MGMMNWRKGADEEDEEDVDGEFDEEFDADEFDLDGDGDDDSGDIGETLDDEWDDSLEDEWADDFGDDDESAVQELQDKVNGMETELTTVSSSMNTIKEENKRIGETVDELDDTIRKLLDVYEIVTRGINPFIDDAQAMANMNNEGSFGLFGEVEEEDDSLDPSLAGADAESFFDDEFDDFGGDDLDDADPEPEPEPEPTATDDGDGGGSGGGVSFEDLKAEYEAGNDDWDDEELDGDPDFEAFDDEGAFDEPNDEDAFDEPNDEDDAFDEPNDEEAFDEGADDMFDDADDAFEDESVQEDAPTESFDEAAVEVSAEMSGAAFDDVDADPTADENESATVEAEVEFEAVEATGNGNGHGHGHGNGHGNGSVAVASVESVVDESADDYHLARLPNSYATELLMMEWAEYLVGVGGTAGAMEAARHYERLGWISPSVGDRLRGHVVGTNAAPSPDASTSLDLRHHVRSLGFVSRLAGRAVESEYVELSLHGGERGGIRG